MLKHEKTSYTHIHPNRKNITCKYEIEYTEKDEDIKDDYSNVKKIIPEDLEKAVEIVFLLKFRKVYNISLYYIIEDAEGWIVEDSCYNIEQIKSYEDKSKINNLIETAEEQEKELEMYRGFIKKYNAEKEFQKYKSGHNLIPAYCRSFFLINCLF